MSARDESSRGQLSLGGTLGDEEQAGRAPVTDEEAGDATAARAGAIEPGWDAGADEPWFDDDAEAPGADRERRAAPAEGYGAEEALEPEEGYGAEEALEPEEYGAEEALEPEEYGAEEALEAEEGADRELEPEEGCGEDAVLEPEEGKTGMWPRATIGRSPTTGAVLTPRQSVMVGAVLGGAIGDAMGHPTEFIGSMDALRAKYGPQGVTGFELYWDRGGRRFAPYTDDTQMAEVVLRSLLESRETDEDLDAAMQRIGGGFVDWADNPQGGHRAPGNACLAGCRALARGVAWWEAGGPMSGGCGSVMRAYPFGLLFAHEPRRAERWAAEHSRLTHGDPIALAASAAMAAAMAAVVRGAEVDEILSAMVAAACRHCANTTAMIARAIHEARTGVEPEVVFKRLQAWAAHEAIAAAAYLVARHPDDPEAAILEGANTPGDSDSIATLAGALVGGRCGVQALPARWVADVERSAELRALALRI